MVVMPSQGGKKVGMVVLGIVAVVLVLVCVFTLVFAHLVMNGKRPTIQEAWDWQSARYDTSFYHDLAKTDYVVKSFDGYELHVELLHNPQPTDRYVIFSHGNTDNHIGSLKYVQMYMDLGYNCVTYDMRRHGEDEPTYCTYGIREAKDLSELVKDTRERYPEVTQLGLHGESLGGSTTIEALEYNPNIDFVISDCAFEDVESALEQNFATMHVPDFLIPLANTAIRLLYGYSIYDIRPIDALDANTVPILFIQGDADKSVPPKSAQDLYDRASGVRELHYIAGAGHAESILVAPQEYRTYVESFLSNI
jgi:fermentation-respiration switch protein FrsA (DUF1100 family)